MRNALPILPAPLFVHSGIAGSLKDASEEVAVRGQEGKTSGTAATSCPDPGDDRERVRHRLRRRFQGQAAAVPVRVAVPFPSLVRGNSSLLTRLRPLLDQAAICLQGQQEGLLHIGGVQVRCSGARVESLTRAQNQVLFTTTLLHGFDSFAGETQQPLASHWPLLQNLTWPVCFQKHRGQRKWSSTSTPSVLPEVAA